MSAPLRPVLSIEMPGGVAKRGGAVHCDQRILHLPEACTYCAAAVDLQQERERLGVSNSGMTNRAWPCPADVARSAAAYSAWPGNRPARERP